MNALDEGQWVLQRRNGWPVRVWRPTPFRIRPTAPGLTCATCGEELYPGLARRTDNGYIHTSHVTGRRPAPTICGTERGYQAHRHQWRKHRRGTWPLPADDPCGCRAAHRAHEAFRAAQGAAA